MSARSPRLVLLFVATAVIAASAACAQAPRGAILRSAAGPLFRAGQPVPTAPGWPVPQPGAANYLEPFDRTLLPGECRLDGLLSAPISSNSPQLQMRVIWATMSGQRRTILTATRAKIVTFGPATSFTVLRRRSSAPTFNDVVTRPFHVVAIGPLTPAGTPITARTVDIEPATPFEVAVADRMDSAAQSAAGRQDPAPIVSLRQAQIAVGGAPETISYIRAEAGTFRIAVGLAHNRVGATESLAAIAQRCGAVAAINGSFFEAYAPGPLKMPDHALISGGRLVARGGVGTVLGQTPDGEMRMERAANAVGWHELDANRPIQALPQDVSPDGMLYWARVVEALGCGPRLDANGADCLAPSMEGFGSGEMLSGVSVRSAVGITQNGSLILVVTHASLPQLAQIMLQLGCRDAMNLDGGASSGLWLRGQSIRTPGRLLSNALLVMGR